VKRYNVKAQKILSRSLDQQISFGWFAVFIVCLSVRAEQLEIISITMYAVNGVKGAKEGRKD
jgi:hypothetical protein